MAGFVYIVGAGPGDPGLLTVKGLACLRESEVVIHDRLIDQRVLREARTDAEIIDLGKQPGKSHQIQASINTLLISKAQAGLTVCRLKGGDPFIFGRGAEEAEVLAKAGIPYDVIPGVSCVSAVPASVGIPLKHRDHSNGFMVLTACHALDRPQDWTTAAQFVAAGGTLVILMGLAVVRMIAQALRKAGCLDSTPLAIISSGTLPEQEACIGTLRDVPGEVERLTSPALIIVGSVISAANRSFGRFISTHTYFKQRRDWIEAS